MKTIIFFGGLYNILFALFHFGFWKLFEWDKDLKKISFANRGIIQILNIQIIYYFIFTAIICFVFPTELLKTKLGNWFLIGTSLFWLIRTMQQFIFLRANDFKNSCFDVCFFDRDTFVFIASFKNYGRCILILISVLATGFSIPQGH